MRRDRIDIVSLVGGAVTVALGVLLLLDSVGKLHLGFAYAAPAVLAAIGAVLLASGLARRPG
jgi:multidrug transporter EmrE-like cation transporter